MSLAEGRVACAVAGAVAGRGGACQSRIHSGGAIDLDLFSPGGEGVVGKHIRYRGRGTGGRERWIEKRAAEEEMFGGVDFIVLSVETQRQTHSSYTSITHQCHNVTICR